MPQGLSIAANSASVGLTLKTRRRVVAVHQLSCRLGRYRTVEQHHGKLLDDRPRPFQLVVAPELFPPLGEVSELWAV